MNTSVVFKRSLDVGKWALAGAVCGGWLTILALSVNGSVVGHVAVVALAAVVGGGLGRLPGAMLGAVYGVLLAALLASVGRSALATGLTVAACAALGGLRCVLAGRRPRAPSDERSPLPFRVMFHEAEKVITSATDRSKNHEPYFVAAGIPRPRPGDARADGGLRPGLREGVKGRVWSS